MASTRAKPLRLEAVYEATFAAPLAELYSQWTAFPGAAFGRLARYESRLEDIRFESTSNQPADFLLVCHLRNWEAIVRLRLTGVEAWTMEPRITEDPSQQAALIDAVLGIYSDLGASYQFELQTITFPCHFELQDVGFAKKLSSLVAPSYEQLEAISITLRKELPNDGEGIIEIQPSYVRPGPSNLFCRVACRFRSTVAAEKLVSQAVEGRDLMLAAIGIDPVWGS